MTTKQPMESQYSAKGYPRQFGFHPPTDAVSGPLAPEVLKLGKGFKDPQTVRFVHYREKGLIKRKDGTKVMGILATGGRTVAYKLEAGHLEFAWCRCSKKDTFNKAQGRAISQHRLEKKDCIVKNRGSIPFSTQNVTTEGVIQALDRYFFNIKSAKRGTH